MNELTINPRFKDLLPPLTPSEMEQLEKSVLEEGIRDSIKVWQYQIVDGHNRYELAQNYNLPFKTIEVYFANEDDVCEWMLTNQLGRRNLEPNIKTLLIGQLYELQKKRVGAPEENKHANKIKAENNVETVTQLFPRTSEVIAGQFGVTEKTVRNAAKVAQAFEKAPEPVKKQFQQGSISQKKLVESVQPKPQPKPNINEILNTDNTDQWTRLCKDFGNRFQKAIRDFESLQSEIMTAFGSNKFPLDKFARRLITTDLSGQRIDARQLKEVVKCPICKGETCQYCNKGYILESDSKGLMDKANYTGITFDEYMEAKNG